MIFLAGSCLQLYGESLRKRGRSFLATAAEPSSLAVEQQLDAITKASQVTVTVGESVIIEATSEKGRSFCSKQAAKAQRRVVCKQLGLSKHVGGTHDIPPKSSIILIIGNPQIE